MTRQLKLEKRTYAVEIGGDKEAIGIGNSNLRAEHDHATARIAGPWGSRGKRAREKGVGLREARFGEHCQKIAVEK